jgi:hypothetical protein
MENGNATFGNTSLWTSITGIILPGCLAILVVDFIKIPNERNIPYIICGFLFVILELVAFGCGIAGRRTATGKAGLAISSILLLLGIVVFLFI